MSRRAPKIEDTFTTDPDPWESIAGIGDDIGPTPLVGDVEAPLALSVVRALESARTTKLLHDPPTDALLTARHERDLAAQPRDHALIRHWPMLSIAGAGSRRAGKAALSLSTRQYPA
jgi:hypothetical protein